MSSVSVLIPTYNEEDNLPDCLRSASWADQVIVVDSYSSDDTLAIANKFTEDVYQHEYVNSATQKNWALQNLPIKGNWVFILDADERIPAELADEIQRLLARDDERLVGYFVNRRDFCFGRWIRHAGMYPNWNLRLFRRGSARYEEKEVDADVAVTGGEVGYLKHPMDHMRFPTISSFMKMVDRYSTWDALETIKQEHDDTAVPADSSFNQLLKRCAKSCFRALPAKWVWLFGYLYIARLGFLDGRAGLTLCLLYAFRQFLADAKIWELKRDPARAEQMKRAATRSAQP
jgi:glycosyltransferase involved in cell wall biosynthesis